MEIERHWKRIPKTSESRTENHQSQPLQTYKIFNNTRIVTEAWYPILPSRKLKKMKSHSFKIGAQRIVLFRGDDRVVRALDAFCPHMGADLGRGEVTGNEIRCYFHRWKYDAQGNLSEIPCKSKLPFNLKIQNYDTQEAYGFIWVYAGKKAPYPVPKPPGLEGLSVEGRLLIKTKLFVHHHVLMASAIDIQHFASVHNLHADFSHEIEIPVEDNYTWKVMGKLNENGVRNRIVSWFLGQQFGYRALFSGGSIVSISYGENQRFRGRVNGMKLPTPHVLWGCVPHSDGVSDAYVFIVQKKNNGIWGEVKSKVNFVFSIVLLAWLKDDDVKAFPRMRFQAQNLIDLDASVAKLISLTEKLKVSLWSFKN
ncbi:MAG: Rieske 2Fe-2S domain-containing protein [Bdellovibrionaceae bacterium]|nr:Rieske 2Fe-2S domain-containing protein [Pseudobdellovibrionaceae bacterium]